MKSSSKYKPSLIFRVYMVILLMILLANIFGISANEVCTTGTKESGTYKEWEC